MKNHQMVPFLLTNFCHFLKWYILLATKFSPLKPPGGYKRTQKGGLIFRVERGSPPPPSNVQTEKNGQKIGHNGRNRQKKRKKTSNSIFEVDIKNWQKGV